MLREEIIKELSLSYDELVNYLLKKYGAAQYDYFYNSTCTRKNKNISRTNEGLICHHIDEDIESNLSRNNYAATRSFEMQKKDRLVYCNYIEHLILHIKIGVLRQKSKLLIPIDLKKWFTSGGIFLICNDINESFYYNGTTKSYKQKLFEPISNNYSDYILILQLLLCYLDNQYVGKRERPFFKEGSMYELSRVNVKIMELNESYDRVRLKIYDEDDAINEWFDFKTIWINYKDGRSDMLELTSKFNYNDYLELVTKNLSKGDFEVGRERKEYFHTIYSDIKKIIDKSYLQKLQNILSIDFHGYGFPCYSEIYLDKTRFGSSNVDEYVSKAFPSEQSFKEMYENRKPIFWNGVIPQKVIEKNYKYIIRIKAAFYIKEFEKPFVQWKENNPYDYADKNDLGKEQDLLSWARFKNYFNKNFNNEPYNNLSFRNGRKITSTYFIDHNNEKTRNNCLIVSLTKEDYELFHEKYNVNEEEILDGCYFE